jgi:hypothetical protein
MIKVRSNLTISRAHHSQFPPRAITARWGLAHWSLVITARQLKHFLAATVIDLGYLQGWSHLQTMRMQRPSKVRTKGERGVWSTPTDVAFQTDPFSTGS